MQTTRMNITLPSSLHDELSAYEDELHEKKSHIIASALEMYMDYLDLKVAEKRIQEDKGDRIGFNDMFKELGVDVRD